MRVRKSKQNLLFIALASLLLALAIPATASAAQGHGRNRNFDKRQRKCAKFVNCHDARNGRWDGRGPQRRLNRGWTVLQRDRVYNRRVNRSYVRQARIDDRLRRQHSRFDNQRVRRVDIREINRYKPLRVRRG